MILTIISIYLLSGLFFLFLSKEQGIKIDTWYILFVLIFWPIAVTWAICKAWKKIEAQKRLKEKIRRRP